MSAIEGFLTKIREAADRDDRGYLATLRRGLSDTTQQQAWPLIVPWCNRFEDETERKIWCTVGGLAALLARSNLDCRTDASLASVMREIGKKRKKHSAKENQDSANPTEQKFRRILDSPDAIDLCNLVVPVVRMAEREGIPLNCLALFWDLVRWKDQIERDNIRVRWTRDFYRVTETEVQNTPEKEDE
jgi:CRISPR type I-E-associated protein CasB/Cse2